MTIDKIVNLFDNSRSIERDVENTSNLYRLFYDIIFGSFPKISRREGIISTGILNGGLGNE
jgi:hypothetical protein